MTPNTINVMVLLLFQRYISSVYLTVVNNRQYEARCQGLSSNQIVSLIWFVNFIPGLQPK